MTEHNDHITTIINRLLILNSSRRDVTLTAHYTKVFSGIKDIRRLISVTRPGYGLAPKSATLPINQRYGPSYVSTISFSFFPFF